VTDLRGASDSHSRPRKYSKTPFLDRHILSSEQTIFHSRLSFSKISMLSRPPGWSIFPRPALYETVADSHYPQGASQSASWVRSLASLTILPLSRFPSGLFFLLIHAVLIPSCEAGSISW